MGAIMYRRLIFACACLFVCMALLFFSRPLPAQNAGLVASLAIEHKDGPDMAILSTIAKRLKMERLTIHAPFKRRLLLMRGGEIDLMPGLLKNPERESFIYSVLSG